MTEGEFQECMIILGYRYNEKTGTAFNSFEGFRNLIMFVEKENRYVLYLDCSYKGIQELESVNQKLKEFHSEHKNYILKAEYKKRRINIVLKMTIDSDIDKDELKALVHFMTELCKSGELVPVCRVCARDRKTGLYVVGKEVMPICEACVGRKRRIYEKRKNVFLNKTQNMPGGIAGALFGAFLGAAIYVLLYQLIPMYGVGSLVISVLSFLGFIAAGIRATKKSAVICIIISCAVFLAAEYAALVFNSAVSIEHLGGGIAISEAVDITNFSLRDKGYLLSILPEISIGITLIMLSGLVYLIKRAKTRPTKISKNIL